MGPFLSSPVLIQASALVGYVTSTETISSGECQSPPEASDHMEMFTTVSAKAEIDSSVFSLISALLPEQAEAGHHRPEFVRPGGVHQPEEAGSQGGGCVHGS